MMLLPILLALQVAGGPGPGSTPFSVGERLEYRGKFGFISAGSAVLEVAGVEPYAGHPSWRFNFTTEVSVPLYRNLSEFSSWTGQDDFISRKFVKHVSENDRTRHEEFLIHPDSGFYRRNASPESKPTSERPLDDVAFFYWIRTVPLEVGKTYEYNNYYRAEQNPVIVKVEKREMKEMPDGSKVSTLLLRPIVDEENGLFSRKSKAKLWLTDDARRIPVEIETTLVIGHLKLILTKVTPGRDG